jgi:hypothetical protein
MNGLNKLLESTTLNAPVTIERIFWTFLVTLVMGLLIMLVYKITYRGVLFNKSFATALLMVSMITAFIILPITSNIILSLGMVGALSIVRFRTALKDPIDIIFMFWGVALGLTTGAGFFWLAIIGSLVIAAIMVVVTGIQTNSRKKPYLVVIRYTGPFNGDLHRYLPRYSLKSKTATAKGFEVVVEASLDKKDLQFIDELQQTEGIVSASVVRYSGDYQ